MRHLTIRNVPAELADRLGEAKRARGQSLNQTVLDLLAHAVGLTPGGKRSNGLAELAGTWSADEVVELAESLRFTEEIDEELWR